MVLWNYYFAFLRSSSCLCDELFGEVKLKSTIGTRMLSTNQE